MSTLPDGGRAVTLTPVHEWLRSLRGCGLHPTVLAVLTMLATYADPDGRNAFPGEQRLAADAGVSVATVRRSLAAARAAGWIVRDELSDARARGRGRADKYRLTVPAPLVAAAVDEPAPSTATAHPRPVARPAHRAATAPTTAHRCAEPPRTGERPPTQVPTQDRPTSRTRRAETAAVVDELARATGKAVDLDHAALVVRDILAGRTVRQPLAYIRAAIQREPARFLPTPIPPRFVREAVAA
ncbi:helix-turn-helix domain-containing protein [Pseudonocardia sichuanensis]